METKTYNETIERVLKLLSQADIAYTHQWYQQHEKIGDAIIEVPASCYIKIEPKQTNNS
jgi:hypothetical protein